MKNPIEELKRYLPIIERAEADPILWEKLTAGTGIATANSYRASITNGERAEARDEKAKAERESLPLSLEQIKKRMNEEGYITVAVAFSLDDLRLEIDDFNDLACESITGSIVGLEDVGYQAVNVDDDNNVIIEVTGFVTSDVLGEEEENDDDDDEEEEDNE